MTPSLHRSLPAAVWFVLVLLCSGCGSLPPDTAVKRESSHAILASKDTALGRIAANSLPQRGLTGFRLLPIGSEALDTRIALAKRAQATLDLQYYLMANDDTGRYLMRTLRDAAGRGVRVRLLLDDLYLSGEDPLLLGLAATPNVEIRLFNPFPCGRESLVTRFVCSLASFHRVEHRMHNKLFIADGAMAVAGGRNIANEYFMRAGVTNFVDLDAFVTGALVPQLQFLFDYYWNSPFVYPLHAIVPPHADAATLQAQFEEMTSEKHTVPPPVPPATDVLGYAPISDELNDNRIGLIWAIADAYADPPDKIAAMMAGQERLPYLDEEAVRFNVLERLRMAQKEVVLTSPYLIPGTKGIEVMRELRARGVKIKLLTNSLAATDEPLVHIGYKRYRKTMLKMGVELHELSPTRAKRNLRLGMFGKSHAALHAKTAVIDRRLVFIGSMNFDPRSEKHNTEMGLFIESPQLAREMLRLMDLDKLQASYMLRLAKDGETLQWLSLDDSGNTVATDTEPDVSEWLQIWLDLLTPFAPVELL